MTEPVSPSLPFGLAIDPGNAQSGWIYFRPQPQHTYPLEILRFGIDKNEDLRKMFRAGDFKVSETRLVIETPAPRGMPTAGEEMETLVMIGRFVQEWSRLGGRWSFVFRRKVKHHITGSVIAKDAHLNQALKDMFGGEQKPIKCQLCKGKGWSGRKRELCSGCDGQCYERFPGPLHGITSHAYAALGVAVWWTEVGEISQHIINPGGRDPRAKTATNKAAAAKTKKTTRILKGTNADHVQ